MRNGHGGSPAIEGLDRFVALRITLAGEPSSQSSYVRNIVEIDSQVRQITIPTFKRAFGEPQGSQYELLAQIFDSLKSAWPGNELVEVAILLSPYLIIEKNNSETDMMRLSQKFEFSASHRLNNPELSDAENRSTFGKCNNLHGHGHNYEVQVTLVGQPDSRGTLMPTRELESIVLSYAIDKLDHKHLNMEVPEFNTVNPSVENIARAIYQMIESPLKKPNCRLKSVTVWETPKTWCEYSPD